MGFAKSFLCPTNNCVEVVLHCVVFGVVTTLPSGSGMYFNHIVYMTNPCPLSTMSGNYHNSYVKSLILFVIIILVRQSICK